MSTEDVKWKELRVPSGQRGCRRVKKALFLPDLEKSNNMDFISNMLAPVGAALTGSSTSTSEGSNKKEEMTKAIAVVAKAVTVNPLVVKAVTTPSKNN
ncbi:hypothetical protein RR46_11171 [Papilio xuthus]|uniref:Uncharacterized protein n=1 Tax=Papilio xuthus TaxID=66420 RepID=A0A194Q3R3_PAPXU|nr:hypothetical protein RR46_11171 [Papilio xuthus]